VVVEPSYQRRFREGVRDGRLRVGILVGGRAGRVDGGDLQARRLLQLLLWPRTFETGAVGCRMVLQKQPVLLLG
jgi:hypothetical protein